MFLHFIEMDYSKIFNKSVPKHFDTILSIFRAKCLRLYQFYDFILISIYSSKTTVFVDDFNRCMQYRMRISSRYVPTIGQSSAYCPSAEAARIGYSQKRMERD